MDINFGDWTEYAERPSNLTGDPAEAWEAALPKAAAWMDAHTFGRLAGVEDEDTLTLAGGALSELTTIMVEQDERRTRGRVSSETVGGWSRSYAGSQQTDERERTACLTAWLGGTGLLYRGCD